MSNVSLFLVGLIWALGAPISAAQDGRPQPYEEAVDALLRVKASTEVGVNLLKYSDLLIDAKTKVDKATAAGVDGKNAALTTAMGAYVDAAAVWDAAYSGKVSYKRGVGKAVMEKYSIPIDEGETYPYDPGYITSRYLIRQLWDRAEASLMRAAANGGTR